MTKKEPTTEYKKLIKQQYGKIRCNASPSIEKIKTGLPHQLQVL
jgi:hypothetical protein